MRRRWPFLWCRNAVPRVNHFTHTQNPRKGVRRLYHRVCSSQSTSLVFFFFRYLEVLRFPLYNPSLSLVSNNTLFFVAAANCSGFYSCLCLARSLFVFFHIVSSSTLHSPLSRSHSQPRDSPTPFATIRFYQTRTASPPHPTPKLYSRKKNRPSNKPDYYRIQLYFTVLLILSSSPSFGFPS
jgi:hypothetical protein